MACCFLSVSSFVFETHVLNRRLFTRYLYCLKNPICVDFQSKSNLPSDGLRLNHMMIKSVCPKSAVEPRALTVSVSLSAVNVTLN